MYAELSITSNFTFLTDAFHPEASITRAAVLSLPAIAIADDTSVAGIARAHARARRITRQVHERQEWDRRNGQIGPLCPACLSDGPASPVSNTPPLILAARLMFQDAPPIPVVPRDRTDRGNLCRILSAGRRRAGKEHWDLWLADFLDRADGLHLLLRPQEQPSQGGAGGWGPNAQQLTRRFAGNMHLLPTPPYDGNHAALTGQARDLGRPTLASAAPLCITTGAASWPRS